MNVEALDAAPHSTAGIVQSPRPPMRRSRKSLIDLSGGQSTCRSTCKALTSDDHGSAVGRRFDLPIAAAFLSRLSRDNTHRSGPGYSVPVVRHHLIGPIRPTRGHIAISPHGGLYAMPSLLRGAPEATRERFRAFRCTFPPGMPPSTTPGSSEHRQVPEQRCRHGLRRESDRLGAPTATLQSVSRGP